MRTIALKLLYHEYSWVVKTRNAPEAVLRPHYHHTDRAPMSLGQCDGQGEYCDPHTASDVFLTINYITAYMPNLDKSRI